MKYDKVWQGTLPKGEYKISYNGNSTDMLKMLIRRLEQNLEDLKRGLVSE